MTSHGVAAGCSSVAVADCDDVLEALGHKPLASSSHQWNAEANVFHPSSGSGVSISAEKTSTLEVIPPGDVRATAASTDQTMDTGAAAAVIQQSFRSWRVHGPLSRIGRRRYLLDRALDFKGNLFLKRQVVKASRAAPTDSFDPECDVEAIKFKAAATIQQFWKSARAPQGVDMDDDLYTPVMFGYTQDDLDSFSKDCRTILTNANEMSHLVSEAGELQIPHDTLQGVAQHFLDSQARSPETPPYDWNAFSNCLRQVFGSQQNFRSLEKVSGADVLYWFRRCLIHESVSARQNNQNVDGDRCVIILSALFWTASGRSLPEDIVI